MPMMTIAADFSAVQESIKDLLYYIDQCDGTVSDAQMLAEDQTTAKWGDEAGAARFKVQYGSMLTELRSVILNWQSDIETLNSRVKRAQETLAETTEDQAAAISSLLATSLFIPADNSLSTAQSETIEPSSTTTGRGYGAPHTNQAV